MNQTQIKEALISLMSEHPNAPIRAIVDEEVVTGEYSTYMADIFSAHYDTFVFYNDRYYDDVGELYDDWEYVTFGEEDIPENEKRLRFKEEFEDKWEEAIIIHVAT